MKVVYALEDAPESYNYSIFLAGPTPRDQHAKSWRPEALEHLERLGYQGVVYVPEDRSGTYHGNYMHQLAWEETNLDRADVILFWVPRDIKGGMPGFTTNVEFGRYANSGKVVFGAPVESEKNTYLRHYANKYQAPMDDLLGSVCNKAINMFHAASRNAGERDVPLLVWNTESFQGWYKSHKDLGNKLEAAKLLWNFRVGPNKDVVFCWVLHVEVWIAAEKRSKVNEFVLSRTDVSNVVMWKKGIKLVSAYRNEWKEDFQIVLVREFRSPVRNHKGFVYENPGGSSFKPEQDPLKVAAEEVAEETGLLVDPCRFKRHNARQLAATLSTHKSTLFSLELTEEEVAKLTKEMNNKTVHGNEEDSERTYIEVVWLSDILIYGLADWSTIGMIYQVLEGK